MSENDSMTCSVCGRQLAPGEVCSRCNQQIATQLFHRETILLLVLAVMAAVLYFGTLSFAGSNRKMELGLAQTWYSHGRQHLLANQPDQAAEDFRKASINDRGNREYALALASALEAGGHDSQAQALLLQVRETSPEDPQVNLELARIAAKRSNVQDSVRYYHNALYGIWTGSDIEARRQQTRRELIQFLLTQQARDQALAEIIALGAHLPDTAAAHLELGQFFLRAGDPNRALNNFRESHARDKQNQAALRGAGEAAYQIGDYAQARRFLSPLTSPDPRARSMLSIAGLVLENDPLAPRLSYHERGRRAREDLGAVSQRLQDCAAKLPGSPDTDALLALSQRLDAQQRSLRHPDTRTEPTVLFAAMELIGEAEGKIRASCGPIEDHDQALFLIAEKARSVEQ